MACEQPPTATGLIGVPLTVKAKLPVTDASPASLQTSTQPSASFVKIAAFRLVGLTVTVAELEVVVPAFGGLTATPLMAVFGVAASVIVAVEPAGSGVKSIEHG